MPLKKREMREDTVWEKLGTSKPIPGKKKHTFRTENILFRYSFEVNNDYSKLRVIKKDAWKPLTIYYDKVCKRIDHVNKGMHCEEIELNVNYQTAKVYRLTDCYTEIYMIIIHEIVTIHFMPI